MGCTFNHSEESKKKISNHNAKYWAGKKRPKLSKEHKEKLTTSRNIKVQCVETGMIFDSISDAARFTGASHICKCLKGKLKSSGGYHWKYVGGGV